LILQWGWHDGNDLIFPIPFPHKCLSLLATREYHNGTMGYSEKWRENKSAGIVDIKTFSNTGATMTGGTSDTDGGAFFGKASKYYWMAIGY